MPQHPAWHHAPAHTDARASSFDSKGCSASRPRVKILVAQQRQRHGRGREMPYRQGLLRARCPAVAGAVASSAGILESTAAAR